MELLGVAIATANIDFCALGQLDHCKKSTKDGVVAIETVRRGYNDG